MDTSSSSLVFQIRRSFKSSLWGCRSLAVLAGSGCRTGAVPSEVQLEVGSVAVQLPLHRTRVLPDETERDEGCSRSLRRSQADVEGVCNPRALHGAAPSNVSGLPIKGESPQAMRQENLREC